MPVTSRLVPWLLVPWLFGCQVGFIDDGGPGGTGDPTNAPVLSELTVEEDFSRWRLAVSFHWSDPQSNVREGVFYIYVAGELVDSIQLPDNAVTLFSDVGEAKLDLTPFLANDPVELELVLEDADGNESEPLTADVDLGRTFVDESESNDSPNPGSINDLGGIERPFGILGHLDALDADGFGNYTGDLDWFKFFAPGGGTASFALYWPVHESDLAFKLEEIVAQGNFLEVMDQDEHTLIPPEYGETTLGTGSDYRLRVAGSDGEPADYVLLID